MSKDKRIAVAVEMLESGQFETVADVAQKAGFTTREAMKNAFARAGMRSPINYLVPLSQKGAHVDPKSGSQTEPGLPELKQWATPAQSRAIDALIKYGSIQNAATALKVDPKQLRRWLSEAKHRAAKMGWSPEHDMTKAVPSGFSIKGVSTYYDKDGKPKGQWVKSRRDEEHRVQLLLDALEKAVEPRKGCLAPIKSPKVSNSELLTIYPVGDAHTGLYCWGEETGDSDFDLKIAERLLTNAVDHLVSLAPPSEKALIINIGDFFHADNSLSRTMRSNNQLDTDSRWSRVLQVGIRMMQRSIDRALEKHKHVTVINEIGNHDDHTSILLSVALSAFYHKEPRVTIDCSPSPFHWFRFGKCLIGTTHGDGPKITQLGRIMSSDKPVDWGETLHRHWYTGHVHHMSIIEDYGVTIETLRTLAPRDAWANRAGYRAGRSMRCDVWHSQYGLINSHTVGIERLNSNSK